MSEARSTPVIRLTIDRQPHVAAQGATARQVLAAAGVTDAVAVRANQEEGLRDLSWLPTDGDRIESIPVATEEGRAVLRHSTAHVMAQAVTDLFPGTKWAIGPPIENGFYYDFDVERPFTAEDVERIEARMRAIVASRQRFKRRVVSADEARALFADQPYKLEVIEAATAGSVDDDEAVDAGPGTEITVYDNSVNTHVAWSDLCRGPHVPDTAHIPAFRLLRTAAAYWRGSERNPQLQRIYGTAWESEEALEAHLRLLAEAERRDHRRLGTELDLFSFPSEIGGGLAVWHPKGGIVRRVMEE